MRDVIKGPNLEKSMARIPALVDAIAQHDWRPRSLISHFGKTARDTGLIASKGMGTAAVSMTTRDAATLLMAVGGAHSPAGAKFAVENLRDMRARQVDHQKRAEMPETLAFLRPEMTFGETLTQLIEHAKIIQGWEADYVESEGDWEGGVSIAQKSMELMNERLSPVEAGFNRALRIIFHQPGLAAEIHLGRPWLAYEDRNAFHEFYHTDGDLAQIAHKDILGSIEVGVKTLVALKNAVDTPNPVVKRPSRAEKKG